MADNKWEQPAAPPPPLFAGKKERDLVKQVNDELIEKIISSFPANDIKNLTVEISPKEQSSDMSCNVAMLLSKHNNKTPILTNKVIVPIEKSTFKEIPCAKTLHGEAPVKETINRPSPNPNLSLIHI